MSTDIAPFRRRDFEVILQVDDLDSAHGDEFAAAVYRAKPFRLDNTIEIEVTHRPDQHVHVTVQMMCDRGVRSLTVRTVYPPEGRASPSPWPFRGARDFHVLMGGDVPVSTAINNTARFPYLEPFGPMLSVGQKRAGSLVDGGYFENEGLQTALDLAEWLAAQSTPDRPVVPIIVQATGDGEADVTRTEVMTCDNASDGAFIPDDKNSALQILAPLIGLYHVHGGHSAVLLRQAHDQFCGARPRFVHFYLPADGGRSIPLN